MAKDKLKYGKNIYLSAAVMFLATMLLVCAFSYIKGLGAADIIRNTVMSGMGAFLVLLFMIQSKIYRLFEYDNGEHLLRFMVVYLICLALAFAISYLPAAGCLIWQFLCSSHSFPIYRSAFLRGRFCLPFLCFFPKTARRFLCCILFAD